MVDRDRHRSREPIPPALDHDGVEEETRGRVDRARDDAQEGHVARAPSHETRKKRREHVQTRRVGKRVAAGRDGREVQIPAEHTLETMRVEHRVPHGHVGMEQHEQLQEEGARRKGRRESRRVAKRLAAPVLNRERQSGHRQGDPDPERDDRIRVAREGSEAPRDDGRRAGAEQDGAADGGAGRHAEQRDGRAHRGRRQ